MRASITTSGERNDAEDAQFANDTNGKSPARACFQKQDGGFGHLPKRLIRKSAEYAVCTIAEIPETRSQKPTIPQIRSEEHTSELQSLMRISYAVFCLKKKN